MRDKKYIQSVDRALDILEYVAQKKVTKLSEISNHLSLKSPTAHALMQTLEHRGYIQRVGKTQYSLGLNSLKLGLLFEWEIDSDKKISDLLKDLADEIMETVYFEFKIGKLHYVYDIVESSQSLKVVLKESPYITLNENSAVKKVYLKLDSNFKYTTNFQEVEKGLNGMAIPFKTDGIITATIAIIGPSCRFTKEKMEEAYDKYLKIMKLNRFGQHI